MIVFFFFFFSIVITFLFFSLILFYHVIVYVSSYNSIRTSLVSFHLQSKILPNTSSVDRVSKLLATGSIILTLMVAGIFVLRVMGKRYSSDHWVNRWNRSLRKHHKFLGILFVVVTLVHGMTSFTGIFKLTWGIVSWICLVLVGLSYALKKKLRGNWIKLHRVFAIMFIVLLMLHLAELPALRELYLLIS